MTVDTRDANGRWKTRTAQNTYESDQHYSMASLAVLMDLRDELQKLNSLLHCSNFTGMPRTLRSILRKLPAPPKKATS